ncbi:MAG: T9SS type A sorting domain-containing protein [Candidatus Marinimicrobia bacterium]|nr:T9SS type A sorting domain-containing protein [Candidatus Neomarinimicrobiota bacterium]MBT4579588.1 T9SS type A sorting domain-containing protein [Candidatus Neomarinimicrobiota bacterium]
MEVFRDVSYTYPNPFNHRVSIPFALPLSSYVVISIYNIMGQIVKTLTKTQSVDGNKTFQKSQKTVLLK